MIERYVYSKFCRTGLVRLLMLVIILPLLAASLGACNVPSDEPPCGESELVPVEDLSPQATVVDTLTPVLTWSYPDSSCSPGFYHISIYDESVIGDSGDTSTLVHEGTSSGTYYSVPASAGLRSLTTYRWSVTPRTADDRGTADLVGSWFSTGPRCGDDRVYLPPNPTFPPDGAEVYLPYMIVLRWDSTMTCWPEGDFYVQISTAEDFTEVVWTGNSMGTEFFQIPNSPPMFEDCARYYWRVEPNPLGGGVSAFSETWSFVPRRTEAGCLFTKAVIRQAANCRSGPGTDYPVLDILPEGTSLEINGRNQEDTWWRVNDSDLQKDCWLAENLVEVSGDVSRVPVIQSEPPPEQVPTDTPVPPVNCAQYNANTCEVENHPCEWDPKSMTCRNR